MIVLKRSSLLFLIGLLLFSCHFFQKQPILTSKKVVRNDIKMLYGKITLDQLYFDYPQWKKVEASYVPQKTIIEKLKKIQGKTTVKIFLGTWCSDSKREVPHFFKIVKQAKLGKKLNITMWAVDRKKNLPNNLVQIYKIEYVPTFIFERNGKEIGRIVESPASDYLEEDIWNILHGNKK